MDKGTLNTIQRIRFPSSPDTQDLYIRASKDNFLSEFSETSCIALNKDETISLNTYFNSFYELYYAKYTSLNSVYYLLNLEGDFRVKVHREQYNEEKGLIGEYEFISRKLKDQSRISLPEISKVKAPGRIYLEIACLSPTGLFGGGCLATDQNKDQNVVLGIIICTFNREIYLKKTIKTIQEDDFLKSKDFKIFVVDNGRTLKKEDFQDNRIKLIPNRNVGGSGGFNRGLIEALEENKYTHFLLMDDDIELESESIFRLFALYEYAVKDFALSGSMLDLEKKYMLHESGAKYPLSQKPFELLSLNKNTNLRDPTQLYNLLNEREANYGAFWFFCFSKEIILEVGLLMPFFIHADDIEFCLRIGNKSFYRIIPLPAIAVWHKPFYSKDLVLRIYYAIRNYLIINSIYNNFSFNSLIKRFNKYILFALYIHRYNDVEMYIKAFKDYLSGPRVIRDNNPERLHNEIINLSKKHSNYSLETFGTSGKYKNPFIIKFVSLYKYAAFENGITIRFLVKLIILNLRSYVKYYYVKIAWKKAGKCMTSLRFWREYLGLNESILRE